MQMFRAIGLLLVCSFTLASPAHAQKGKAKPKASKSTSAATAATTSGGNSYSGTVLATVGGEKVLYEDVERAFQKNLSRRDTPFSKVPRDTALEFLQLYTNYRLKVASARERGVDKDPAVAQDIANNRKLLSETFFFDKAVADARVAELTRRRTREMKVAIILCAVTPKGASQWDSVASLKKAMAVVQLLNNGADFEKLARDSSDDKETGANGGVLPWLSGGTIIKVVEDEAYEVPVGSYSKTPVHSRFGYFIVKVLDSQPRQVVKFRHILLTPSDSRDSVATIAMADSLVSILKMPSNKQASALSARGIAMKEDAFTELAKAYSDDKASAPKGGFLGSAYSRSGGLEAGGTRLVPAFEEAVFALKDGQVSNKVRTIYGWHIIIRDSTRWSDEQMERDNARRTYRRLYYEEDKRRILDSLRTAYGYGWNTATYTQFRANVDSTKTTQDTTWLASIPANMMSQVLYTTPSGPYTVAMFTDSLRRRLDMRGYTLNTAGLERAVNKMTDNAVIEQATVGLERRYPEFDALMREFNDGILLFKVEEQEVWSKLKFDTTDARAYYDTTKSRWLTETGYAISEIYCITDKDANDVRSQLKSGADFATLAAARTQREGLREKQGKLGTLYPKTSKLAQIAVDSQAVAGSIIGPFSYERGFSVLRVDGIEPPRVKTFEEALPDLAPAYQDALQKRLTETWLSDVRQRFPVTIDTSAIDRIYGKAKR